MSIYERYELLDIVNDGPVKTFRAREIQTGQIVAVHLLLPLSDPQGILQKVRIVNRSCTTGIAGIRGPRRYFICGHE